MNVHRLTEGEEALWLSAIAAVPAEENEDELASAAEIAAALADRRCYLFVATRDGNPVGLLSAYRFPDVTRGGEIAYLYDIEVCFEYRRQGLGKQLVDALVECCTRDNVKLIWAGTDVRNAAARRTFEVTGAELEGQSYAEYEWDLD